jgi:hypothetical protein
VSDWTPTSEDAIGILATYAVKYAACPSDYLARTTMASLRVLWPTLEDYYKRQIICAIEVAVALDRGGKLAMSTEWTAFAREMRGPKTPFTVDYRCGKCRRDGLKLWRGVHACPSKDGHELLCAACLAPGVEVDEDGRAQEKSPHGMRNDQVGGWLPAVPTGDSYWGYSSVPSQDVDWWKALPTYPTSERRGIAEGEKR